MSMPQNPRPSLAIALLVAMAAFSTTACSTTNGSAPTDADGSAANQSAAKSHATSKPTPVRPAPVKPAPEKPAANSAASSAAGAREFSMRPGDSIPLANNGSLSYLRMANDSRCPPGAQCIWEGNAELSFQWQKPGGGRETFSLNTSARGGPQKHDLGSQRLTLVSVARGPGPAAKLRLEPGA